MNVLCILFLSISVLLMQLPLCGVTSKDILSTPPRDCSTVVSNIYGSTHRTMQTSNSHEKLQEISVSFCRCCDIIYANINNFTTTRQITNLSIHINQNSFGLQIVPDIPVTTGLSLIPNASVNIWFPLNARGPVLRPMNPDPLNSLQIVIIHNFGEFNFTAEIPINFLLSEHESDKLGYEDFQAEWDQIAGSGAKITIPVNLTASIIQQKLEVNKVFMIAQHTITTGSRTQQLMYMAAKFINNIRVLLIVEVIPGSWTSSPEVGVTLKTNAVELIPNEFVLQYIMEVISY